MPAITAHFSEAELVAGLEPGTVVPADVRTAAHRTAELLEDVRAALGVPLDVTSWYRTPEHNLEVGGVEQSQHLTGNAADVIPRGLLLGDAYDRFRHALEAGKVRDFGQAIFYPVRGHLHLSTRIGTNAANSVLFAYPKPGGGTAYTKATAADSGELPRGVAVKGSLLVILLLVALLVLAVRLLH